MDMQKQLKTKIICCMLAAMMLPASALTAVADETTQAAEKPAETTSTETDGDAGEAGGGDDTWVDRSEDDVLAKMRIIAENDNLVFYGWDESKLGEDEQKEDLFALKNKKNGYIWWTSPINAQGDGIAAPVLQNELRSALVLTAAQIEDRSTTNARSTSGSIITYSDVTNGIRANYNFRKVGITIPVTYTLCEDYLKVSIDTKDIKEKYGTDSGEEKTVLAQQLAVFNAFGAGGMDEEGQFVIPDGSGAYISFNNEKYTARSYSQLIYDVDTTAVPKTKGPVVEGVSLPMYGICKGENALLAVAAKGDGSCYICADISGTGASNTEYNRCYFKYLLRSSDSYYLGSDMLNPLDVYERTLSNRELEVRYYPLCTADAVNADGGSELDYVDLGTRYRQYLIEDKKVQQTAKANTASLFIDLYGGCMKQKNVLGFPVFMKTSMTSYSEMQDILEKLKNAGIDDMTVSLNRWTDAGIAGKVDYKGKASGTLGGKSDFKKLTDYMNSSGIAWYPTVSNTAYYSGQGYWSLTDTAVRVSGSFARIVDYERAYGVPYGTKKTMSLLSPATFPELYQDLAKNYRKQGLTSVSIGALSSTLYGDYGKKSGTARDTAMQYIEDSLKLLKSDVGAVLSEDPSAYVLPYTDTITDVPLYSSGFNLFDGDVPLYQVVLHGLIPFSTKAVNGSADAEHLVMLALSTGSSLHFDLLHAETSDLKDTDFDVYYYAYYDYWIENAAQYQSFVSDILKAVSDSPIITCKRDGDKITTVYANGTETLVDLKECAVTWNGQTRYLKDYVKEGADVFE